MKNTLTGSILLFSLVALLSVLAHGEGDTIQPKGKDQRVAIDRTIQEAEDISVSIEKTGAQLLAVLKDGNCPSKERTRCAMALGRLKYLPAVRELIGQIELHDEEHIISESAIEVMYPCVRALSEYGTAAIAETVSAYMKEGNPNRKRLLATTIALAKSKDMAIAYAKGLAIGSADTQASQRVQSLVDTLK